MTHLVKARMWISEARRWLRDTRRTAASTYDCEEATEESNGSFSRRWLGQEVVVVGKLDSWIEKEW